MININPRDKPTKETYTDEKTGKEKVRYLCSMCQYETKYVEAESDRRLNMRYFCTHCNFATNKIGKL